MIRAGENAALAGRSSRLDNGPQYQSMATSQPCGRPVGRARAAPSAHLLVRESLRCNSTPERRPPGVPAWLLANPENTGHPGHIALGDAAAGGAAADRFELDLLSGLTNQLLGHQIAAARLDDDAIAAMEIGIGRHDHDVAGPVGRGQGIAADLEGEGVRVADAGRIDLIPALADGMPGIIEQPAAARLGILGQRQRVSYRHATALADERQKAAQRLAGGGQAFRDALRARPARLAGRALALAFVEGGRVEAGAARESRSRQAMLGSQAVQGAPDFRVTQHVQSSLLI